MTFKTRIMTKPGYKFIAGIIALYGFFYVMQLTQPIVEVNGDNMVVSVNGESVYRPVMNWDLREAKIIRVK